MREQHTLGQARGAGRVLDVGHVVGRGVEGRYIAAAVEEVLPGVGADPDGVIEAEVLAVRRMLEDLAVVRAFVRFAEEERLDAGAPQDIFEFVGAIRRVDVDQDDTGPRRGVLQEDPFGAVRRPDADAFAGFGQPGKTSRRLLDRGLQGRPREAQSLVPDDERVTVGELGGWSRRASLRASVRGAAASGPRR